MSRGEFFTLEKKKTVLYSDFLISFDRNPTTDNLAVNLNEAAVKRSIKNIVLTKAGERFYDSKKGSRLLGSLFDLYDPVKVEVHQLDLKEAIQRYEPRASPVVVRIIPNPEQYSIRISIEFGIINIYDETFELDIIIKKVR